MTTTTNAASAASAVTTAATGEREPVTFESKIGSTVYQISVHFNPTAKETIEDKILRLIEREVQNAS